MDINKRESKYFANFASSTGKPGINFSAPRSRQDAYLAGNERSSSNETTLELECARLLRAFHNGYRSDIPLECESIIRDSTNKKSLSNLNTYHNRIPPALPKRKGHYNPEDSHGKSLPDSEDDSEIRDGFLRRVTSTISNFDGVVRKTSDADSSRGNAYPTLSLTASYNTEKVFESEKIHQSKETSNYTQRRKSCSTRNTSDDHPSYCESYQHYLMTGYSWE